MITLLSPNTRKRALALTATVAVTAGLVLSGASAVSAKPSKPTNTSGFKQPFYGVPVWGRLSATQATNAAQVNAPLGIKRANRLALALGMRPGDAFTQEQYELFVSGGGVGGSAEAAQLVQASAAILTNTTGSPIVVDINGVPTPTVFASYGLWVNEEGLLESPANSTAPTRQINALLVPGGYLSQWCKANGAAKSLAALYGSAYTLELPFAVKSQDTSGVAQLVQNTKGSTTTIVGMSMAPSIWLVNFVLLYMLSPQLAAKMPAYWQPIPAPVAQAIAASPTGQVPYADFASYFAD